MDKALEALKNELRAKHFAIDDFVPLSEKAANAIERLQGEIAALMREVRGHRETICRVAELERVLENAKDDAA
jgi:hypothetical protein